MTGQKITIEVHDKKVEPAKKVQVKVNNKRKDHYKKYSGLLWIEFKELGSNSYKVLVNLCLVLWYSITVLGDLLLLWNGNKSKKASNGEKPKKNILDEGW